MCIRDRASTNGEAVLAESYFQHAEHYYRILSAFTDEANNEQNKNRATQPGSNENNNHDQQETPITQSAAKNGKEKLSNNNGAEMCIRDSDNNVLHVGNNFLREPLRRW